MINRNTRLGKMLSKDKIVYQCIRCGVKFIGTADTNIDRCSACKEKGTIVVNENLSVIEK